MDKKISQDKVDCQKIREIYGNLDEFAILIKGCAKRKIVIIKAGN